MSAAEKVRQQVASRYPKRGKLFYRDEQRRSALVGGERALLKRITAHHFNGELYGVDGIFTGGINIAVKVSSEELERIKHDPSKYFISAEVELSNTPG